MYICIGVFTNNRLLFLCELTFYRHVSANCREDFNKICNLYGDNHVNLQENHYKIVHKFYLLEENHYFHSLQLFKETME